MTSPHSWRHTPTDAGNPRQNGRLADKSHSGQGALITDGLAHQKSGVFSTIADVEACISRLAVVADWGDELRRKLDRASLRFELCGLDAEEQEQLTQEVFAFTSLCRALADTLRRGE